METKMTNTQILATDSDVSTVHPQVEMIPGDVSPFLDFMSKFLPNETDRKITLSYLAACVQYPGVKFQWAPVYQGCQGNGKTMLSSCVEYAIGPQNCLKTQALRLTEGYNWYIATKLFITVEEVHMGDRRDLLDELRPLITDETVEVRGTRRDKAMVENVSNFFFCTNHRKSVIKSINDRRYAIFFTAQQNVDDLERDGMGGSYFPKLWSWLRSGGYAHVAHYLKTYPIQDHLNPAKFCTLAPNTSCTKEV
jgi:phage/plasmid-associated DNA primase